jgi:hypothetical protein
MEQVNTKVSWIKTKRIYDIEPFGRGSYSKKLYITKNNEEITDSIERLSITPLPHQKVTVKSMLDVERIQFCKVTLPHKCDDIVFESRAAVLSEHPGSGKTIEILMLIALNPILPKKPEITSLPFYRHRNRHNTSIGNTINTVMEVKRTYNKVYPQTLIFVGKSVLAQWMDTINTCTDFSVFMIGDIFSLRTFYSMCFNPKKVTEQLSDYEIILVKNSNISGKFDIPELKGTPLENTRARPILNIFGELFKNKCWSRVVLDDFDYLNISTTAKIIPSLFTWFVSATKRMPPGKKASNDTNNVQEMLESYRPYYGGIWNNRELFTFFNLGCEDSFIDWSTKATVVKYSVYKFHNPNDNYIGLLGVMGTEEANTIMEMLNGDAIQSAAETAGIKTNSVADIFEKVLDKKWEIYKKSIAISKYITNVKDYVADLPAISDPKELLSSGGLEKFKKNIKKPGPFSRIKKIIKFKQSSVSITLDELNEENNETKEEHGKAIQRVKDNIRHGECPITCELLSDVQSIVIMKCCGMVLSSEAISWGVKMKTTGENVKGSCPNCRADVSIRDMIYIDKDDVDFDNILDEDNALKSENKELADIDSLPVQDSEFNVPEPVEMNKYNCIIDIIRGKIISEVERRRDIFIPGLLVGDCDRGDALIKDKKILIFANFKETMKIIERKISENDIPYLKIQGTPNQIKDAVHRYNLPNDDEESINILLINGPTFVAGLNLQNTTDLIFTGKVIDANIETQIAGRICRIGRQNNANIHYVLYENEYAYMFGAGRRKET